MIIARRAGCLARAVAQIGQWRRGQRLELTARVRPDLIDIARGAGLLTKADEAILAAVPKNLL